MCVLLGFTILIAVITAGYDRACELPPRKGVFNSTVKAYQRWRSSDEPKKKKKDAKPPATKVEMYRDIGSQMGDTLSMLQQKIDEQHEATVGRIAAMGDKFHARLDALTETMAQTGDAGSPIHTEFDPRMRTVPEVHDI